MIGEITRYGRTLFLAVALLMGNCALLAAPACPVPAYTPKASDKIMDWYDVYVRPFRVLAGIQDSSSLSMDEVAALIDKLENYHRNSFRDSFFFEALMRQMADSYQHSPDFRGVDTQVARKIYQRGSGADLDFTIMCIDARTVVSPDDTVALTLFGMNRNDCQHVGLRGLVYTEALINGAVNGECHLDHVYYRMLIFPVTAGTNAVTFLCRKGVGGCVRQ